MANWLIWLRDALLRIGGVAVALSLLMTQLAAAEPARTRRPNILVIAADDLAYSDLGAFGGEISTPNLDSLALRGTRLTHFYTAPACSPTRAMLLTGRDNHQVGFGTMLEVASADQRGAPGYEGYLPSGAPTLPECLLSAGYSTLMAGKWHLGGGQGQTPAARGFERSYALIQGAHNHFGADQSAAYREAGAAPQYLQDGQPVEYPVGGLSSDVFTDQLLRELQAAPEGKPFFAYLAFTAPHWPLQAKPEIIARYRGMYDGGPVALRAQRLARMTAMGLIPAAVVPHPVDESWFRSLSAAERRIESRKMEVYAAMVESMDQNVGRVLQALRSRRQLDDTIIVFLSDNGPEGLVFSRPINPAQPTQPLPVAVDNSLDNLGAANSYFSYGPNWAEAGSTPYRGTKEHTSEGGIRAPLIIAGPHVLPGRVAGAVSHVSDIMPTLLDLAAAQSSRCRSEGAEAGLSLARVLDGSAAEARGPAAVLNWELFYRAAVRRGHMKAIYQPTRLPILGPQSQPGEVHWQLFNLQSDVGETRDLARENPELLRDLIGEWRAYARRTGVVLLPEDEAR